MRFKLKPFFKDISLTFIAEAVALVAFFFVYRLIAKNFGAEGVGEYSLIKRITAFWQPVLLLGLGIGIPRYVAMARNEEERSGYVKAGALTVGSCAVVFLVFIILFKESFAKIFFGAVEYASLILPLSFFLAGLIFTDFVYSYFRGRLFVKTFNLLRIINLALVPIAIIIFAKDIAIESLISLIGVVMILVAFIFLLVFIKEFFIFIPKRQFKKTWIGLLKYGLPRLPGDFALAGILSLGPIFAAHFVSMREVGYLSVSQSLLGAVGAGLAPIGLVLLPKTSNLIASGRQEAIRENLNLLIAAVIQCSIFICIQLIIFADVIIKYWLGTEFLNAVPALRIAFLSIFFYVFYVAVRSVLDAARVKPINTINLFISLAVFLAASGILLTINIFSPIISLNIAFTSGFICLAILSYFSIREIYPANIKEDIYHLRAGLIINILLGSLAICLKPFVSLKFYYLIFFFAVTGLIYLLILWLLKTKWIRRIPEIVRLSE